MQAEKTRGDYRTRTGEAVRRLMEHTKGEHLTADEVRRLLSEEGISMGLSTVYRQLDRLVAEGAVQRISGDRVGSCYAKKTASDSSHYHLVCHVCGHLSHVDCETFEVKNAPGLYVVGETLDCAGSCGGFNLHFAFGSGMLAGRYAAKSVLGG